MAEYLIQDTTLDGIADAINAKTGGSSAMTPAEMVTEIESISGGSLPTSISKIDGGSFTFVSDTTVTEQITHNLGVIPIGVMVWCDTEPYPNLYFGCLFNNPVNNNVFRVIGYRTGSTMDRNTSYQGTAPLANMLTSTVWSLFHGSYKYKGGTTYKWIALA